MHPAPLDLQSCFFCLGKKLYTILGFSFAYFRYENNLHFINGLPGSSDMHYRLPLAF